MQGAAGIVTRDVGHGPPITVTYTLAEDTGELFAALRALKVWAATKAS